jgi:hypothetical protein
MTVKFRQGLVVKGRQADMDQAQKKPLKSSDFPHL